MRYPCFDECLDDSRLCAGSLPLQYEYRNFEFNGGYELTATVLVTGYGGFLGSAICKDLLNHGYRVRGLARSGYPVLKQLGVECIQGSAADKETCIHACDSVDAVIHTAAMAGVWGPAKKFEHANVDATDFLLDACKKKRVNAFVFTSSPSVTFDGRAQCNIAEEVPYPTRWLCHYPRTKAIAEQHVLDANNSSRFSTCALRPHLIWGVGDPHLIPRVIQRCRSGRLRCVGDGKNLIDTVHVEHAAIAHRLALERMLAKDSNAAGRAYFITDDQPVGCWDWITTILQSVDLQPPKKRIRFKTAYRLGAALELGYRIFGKTEEPPMTRFVAAQLGVDHYFDIKSAKARLGYKPIENRAERISELGCTIKHT
jgi:2-alkyl-3-oxoalkanoate reductase